MFHSSLALYIYIYVWKYISMLLFVLVIFFRENISA
jgi:hypothetical protein